MEMGHLLYSRCTKIRYTDDNIEHEHSKNATQKTKTLSFSKELTSWVKLEVEIFCKARLRLALQKISTCSLTHDVSSNPLQVEIFCKARLRLALQKISTCSLTHDVSSLEDDNINCQSCVIV